MFPLPSARTHEAELSSDTGVSGSGGHHNPDHLWDMSRLSMFLLSPTRTRGTSISLRVRHEHRVFHRQAKGARVWVEVEVECTGWDFGGSGVCLRRYSAD